MNLNFFDTLKVVSIISFFFTFSGYVQKTTLSGQIKDNLQNTLPYAKVIAKPKDVSKNMQFAISDNEDYYKLILEKKKESLIKVQTN